MEGYKGTTPQDISMTKYANYTPSDWAMLWIGMYGQNDGSHHKARVIDDVARILKGTKMILEIAEWENGHKEERFSLADPPKEYLDWVEEMKDGEDGPNTYSYDYGC